MRHSYPILLLIFFCLAIKVSGQPVFIVKGVISKHLSTERVAQVFIKNLRSNDIMESDDLGWFSIKTAIGDTLLFTKNDYTPQKVVIKNTGDLPVSMQPVIKLNEVVIKGQTKRQELSDIMSDYRRQGIYYDGKPPVLAAIFHPLTGIYELLGAGPGQAKRFAAFSKREEENTEVDRRYNIALVTRVTHTPDSTAKKFMEFYTPSFEDLKEWNDYELIKHIKLSFDFYEKSPDKEKLERLNTPPLVKPGAKENP